MIWRATIKTPLCRAPQRLPHRRQLNGITLGYPRCSSTKSEPVEAENIDSQGPASLDEPVITHLNPPKQVEHGIATRDSSNVSASGPTLEPPSKTSEHAPKDLEVGVEGNPHNKKLGHQSSLIRHAELLASPSAEEKEHTIVGLVRSIRKQKRVAFAQISDGSTLASLQAVLSPEMARDINNGSAVRLSGLWKQSRGAGQSHELQATSAQVLGDGEPADNPLQKQSMANDFLRTVPHLRLRTQLQSLLARVRSHLMLSVHKHFADENEAWRAPVYQVQPPLITSSDCEGAGEVFTVSPRAASPDQPHYFREPKYLTVSSQLHLEAYAAELGNVYTLSPTFRAEESDTSRHLAEFYMLEAEYRAVDLTELLDFAEGLISSLCRSLREHKTGEELLTYWKNNQPKDGPAVDLVERWKRLEQPFVRISYSDAAKALQTAHEKSGNSLFEFAPVWDQGLQLEHERWIVEHMSGGRPTIVFCYPKAIKPFYMEQSPGSGGDGATVDCFDILLPFGTAEAVGGSMRESSLEQLVVNMRQKGLLKAAEDESESDYPFLQPGESLGTLRWYADLRRFGSSAHGGFGLGFDRLVGYLTGLSHIRDVVGFPRYFGKADC